MERCTTCGAEVTSAFCSSCGAPAAPRPEPELPWSPARSPRRRATAPAALAVAAVAVAAGLGTWVGSGDGEPTCPPGTTGVTSEDCSSVVEAPTPSGPTATSSAPTTAPPTVPPPPPPPPSPAGPRGATGTPFWTVIVASKSEAEGGEAAAEGFRARLEQAGFQAEVFHSSAHSSLRAGYWVAATGRFPTGRTASAHAADVKSTLGLDIAYPRCVGTASECPGS